MQDGARVHAGHTLIETLVVLSVVAVLASLAWPAFGRWLLDSRREASVQLAVHAVHAARQFAATRGIASRLCGSDDGLQWSGRADWSAGLLVIGDDERVHRSLPLASQGRDLRVRSNRAIVRFEAGTSFASPATIAICDRRGTPEARAVIISRSGRPRISARDAGDGPIGC